MVTSFAEAVRIAVEFVPAVALIDIRLAGESGYALARRLRLLPGLERLRLIAATGLPRNQVEAQAKAEGVVFYRCLLKPISPSALYAAVEDGVPADSD